MSSYHHNLWYPSNLITTAILFVDQVDSVMLSNTMNLVEYDKLLNEYQKVLQGVVEAIREQGNLCLAEARIVGDELFACFYNPKDVATQDKLTKIHNKNGDDSPEFTELYERLQREHDRHLFGALITALKIKNRWIGHECNIERLRAGKNPIEVGCGINAGRVSLAKRYDGKKRIEGYAINYAKRVETASRFGRSSRIALSRFAFERINKIRVRQFLLKQRVFCKQVEIPSSIMKGISAQESIYELTFYHALKSASPDAEQAKVFDKIFWTDPTSFWAYCNVIDHLLYSESNYPLAKKAAEQALYANPPSEKIYYDLANIHFAQEDFETAREYCYEALKLNNGFDLAYELLIDIEEKEGKDYDKMLEYASKAVAFTPGSAFNHFALARAHTNLGNLTHAKKHARTMLELYPDYAKEKNDVRDFLKKLDIDTE